MRAAGFAPEGNRAPRASFRNGITQRSVPDVVSELLPVRKGELRRQVAADLATLTIDTRTVVDQEICRQITTCRAYRAACQVFGYMAVRSEVSLATLFDDARHARKRMYLPRVAHDGSLNYISWRVGDPLIVGSRGQLEPTIGAAPLGAPSLILVPGMAFDEMGRRLGRGGGCYDRGLPWLEGVGPTIGVAYEMQIVARIPCGEHDRSVQWIATESGMRAARASRQL
jgi:5-formyltetrahydrofolate cyclo-ligase